MRGNQAPRAFVNAVHEVHRNGGARQMTQLRNTLLVLVLILPHSMSNSQPLSAALKTHDFYFADLARTWDEGIPLGNGMLGALIWQRDSVLRISLDRADLWDLRPIEEFQRPEFRFAWVVEQATNGDYRLAQELGDVPYDRDPAPTKLPGAALEIPLPHIGEVETADLKLNDALCVVRWKSGVTLEAFVHATKNVGWFRIIGLKSSVTPRLLAPPYVTVDGAKAPDDSGPEGNDLGRLGYPAPRFIHNEREVIYQQECWDGFSYAVHLSWEWTTDGIFLGRWAIQPNRPYPLEEPASTEVIVPNSKKEHTSLFEEDLVTHEQWWTAYWSKSSIRLPDTVLERQWYREMYKFGSASRRGAPPITLQAVWTADNGRLPPWKGDFHHDLNTELSYWPSYSSNHLEEGLAFLDWLWWCRPVAQLYTKTYFGTTGLNFPGVSTLTGEAMGGWIQYSLSPTVSAWLAHHFYLHWRYSLDSTFLRERAYPWIRGVAIHLDELSLIDSLGNRRLPLSSSPEINDNRVTAWFTAMTNYDVALVRWLYGAAAELALVLGNHVEASRWMEIRVQWPDLALSPRDGKLMVAPEAELTESHRHFSHLMAIHPLGLLDWDRGTQDKRTITASLEDLERLGSDWWCGYSYAWLGSMWARARNGTKAAGALHTFATCFCLPNSFHVNGDQSGSGKSKFTYRPFTLEGNFAYAQGIQEMLLQSQGGKLRIFPAIPESWSDVSFTNLRAEGALLVSASRRAGHLAFLTIFSEKGGTVRLVDPFDGRRTEIHSRNAGQITESGNIMEFDMKAGGIIEFSCR